MLLIGLWSEAKLYLSLLLIQSFAIHLSEPQISLNSGTVGTGTVCTSIDIRNSVENFNKLRNCTVVEGHVQIVLIDNGTPKDYENLTFPALREITDYLLLFRAMGLPSLGKLFPNLSVIRGRNLFHDFAFVVYEMLHLQQLGLKSLTDVVRGAVRIEKNPNLCFVETIDWDRIAKSAKFGHFIHGNKPQKECPICSSECKMFGSARRPDGKLIGDQSGRLCWSSQNDSCQHFCPEMCDRKELSCTRTEPADQRQCCDKNCLSGCDAKQNCLVCRKFFHTNKCQDKCPSQTYEYLGRRCVSKHECLEISRKYFNKDNKYLKPILSKMGGTCTFDCPPGYSENSEDPHKCVSCDGPCPKVCPAAQVTNIASAQSLRGCTKINGSLEIYIQSGGANVIRELEESLEQLEEISGFLKVARSFPLITLNFLKSLRLIEGNQLERNEYSFLVLDNPNLQDLWIPDDFNKFVVDSKFLTIAKGKIFFHINPKLCYNKIEKLRKYANIVDHHSWDTHDVSPATNGDKVACEVNELNVYIWGISSEMVGIGFENFKLKMDDQRSLLGYLIYYKETLFKNVSIYDGRDACSTNLWKVDDYEAVSDNEDKNITHIIPGLKPFTQYALYIKTYTIASETKGAQSKIIYFKTKEDTPTQPRQLKARSLSSSQIKIEWDEPSRPNGEVTHYIVNGTRDSGELDFLNDRDYCREPITQDTPKKSSEEPPPLENNCTHSKSNLWLNVSKNSKDPEECCSCKPQPINDVEVERRISFEDHLINSIYIKKQNISTNIVKRRRREQHERGANSILLRASTKSNLNATTEATASAPEPHIYFKQIVALRSAIIHNLSHFTEYTIEVRACQGSQSSPDRCSLKAMTSVRTQPLGGADDIDESSINVLAENTTESQMVILKWDEPIAPNGFIVSYEIEYKKASSESTPNPVCITRDQYLKNSGYLVQDLSSGNYSLRLRAHSLASWGNWTNYKYFIIPDKSSSFPPIIFYVVIPVVIIVSISFVAMASVFYLKYKKDKRILEYVSVNPEYLSAGPAYEPDPNWEVPRDKIKVALDHQLGQGSFGMVYEGEYQIDKKWERCAVKTVNDTASPRERNDFLKEADVMKAFDNCNHVVKLLGIVSREQPFYVLMEMMSNGDLRSYLRDHRPDSEENPGAKPPTLPQLLQMAIEIADGMAYLGSKKFVHRDLAARNCMVAHDLTVKIGDFGMTRDIYETDYYRKGGKALLPVRWMAPESLKDGVFTTHSDVWSYGVVLWEMATLASQPYYGLANEAVLKYVVDGGRMERPENCPQKLWDLMSMCWSRSPKHRPNFVDIIEILKNDSNERFMEISFYSEYIKSQLKQKSSSQSLHDDPSAPLKPLSNTSEENLMDAVDGPIRYFPNSRKIITEFEAVEETANLDIESDNDKDDSQDSQDLLKSVSVDNQNNRNHNNTTGNNANSKQSSDGSKGSKISSTTSNGSIANGHLPVVQYKTTTC